jgi:uncharacterized protein with HEPN domain
MKRDLSLFVIDILESIENVESFLEGISKEDFVHDIEKQSAVVRQLEIIGEAVKNIPEVFREKYPEIPWRKVAGLRDMIIHVYFNVDLDVTWDIVKKDVPDLKQKMLKIKKDLK